MKQPVEWRRKATLARAGGPPPHYAPPAAALEIFARRIEALPPAAGRRNAMILGATPELADLAAAAGWRPLRIDCNPAMVAAADLRRANGSRDEERIIVADWLAMPLAAASVDLVLGDAALNNIPHESMPAALATLRRVCRPGAAILLRQLVLPDLPVAEYEVDAVLAARRAGRIDDDALDRAFRFYSFNAEALDPTRHLLDAERVFAAIRRMHESGRLLDAEHAFLMGRYSAVQHTIYPLAEQCRWLATLGSVTLEPLPESLFYHRLYAVLAVHVG